MPEKKTSGIIVPVPELSREARCALAFATGILENVATDVSEVDPMPDHKARPELLKIAALAIERAIDGAVSHYRDAMREKYAPSAAETFPPTMVSQMADAQAERGKAEDEVAVDSAVAKSRGIFRR